MNSTTKARLIRGSLWAAHYFLLIPLGYPAPDCRVPQAALARKPLEEVLIVR